MVVAEKQIEPPAGAATVLDRSSDLVDDLQQTGIRVVNRRDEGQIPLVGGLHHPAHVAQAVLAQRSELPYLVPITLLHHTVSLERGHAVGCAFHLRHDTELVVDPPIA